MTNILIVDDDPSLQEVLEVALNSHNYYTFKASSIQEAYEQLNQEVVDLALIDLWLGQENGMELLKKIKNEGPEMPVLMLTAYADSETAVEAIKIGAHDYISKPFNVEELLLQIDRIIQNTRLAEENIRLKQQIQGKFGTLLGESPQIREVFDLVQRIAPTSINVLVTGESGTGKELFARAIHENSTRQESPLMIINCGGLPENLVESELFGYRKGAFTGADRAKKGLLEKADKGTCFLDEVGELQMSTQVKLLRCIQDGSFIPLGGTNTVNTDVRFVAATNKEIEQEVAEARFREDLFYRLSGVIIKIPPLRERGDDLFLLAENLLQRFCKEQNKEIKGFSQKALEKMQNYRFPGNIRELENIIERSVALETSSYITPSSLIIYESIHPNSKPDAEKIFNGEMSLDEYLENEDKKVLQAALEKTQGHKSKAAELVGLSFRQFRYRLSKHNIGSQGEQQ
ncbi:MAG: sigma-54-dependent transcriptional regulator [Thermodesulfobacteriota bacterium]